MPPVPVLTRDLALDQNLESEARLTLILVAAGLGVLILATLVVFFGYRLLGFFRFPSLRPSSPSNTTCSATLEPKTEVKKPETASVASTDIIMPSNQPYGARATHEAAPHTPKSKIPFILPSIRKHASAPHRPTGIYTGFGRSPFQVSRPSPTASEVQSRMFQSPSHITPPPPPAHTKKTGFAIPQGIVTPHIAGWMKVADSVVGRHPDAKHLHTRVATQADIDLISGHLHMPWAAFSDDNQTRSQPIPVKVLRPDTRDTTPVFQKSPAPEILKDVGNTRARVVLISVNNNNGGASKKDQKRAHKGRSPRSAFGKENIPAAPSSSLPQPQAVSGRRI